MLASKTALTHLDGIMIVRTLSHHYTSPAKQLAHKLGAKPKFTHVSGIGGNSPQTLINIAAGMIARNELDSVLIVGAEAYIQREKNQKRLKAPCSGAYQKSIPEMILSVPQLWRINMVLNIPCMDSRFLRLHYGLLPVWICKLTSCRLVRCGLNSVK